MTTEPQVELILFPVMCGVVEFGLKKVSPKTPNFSNNDPQMIKKVDQKDAKK